MEPPVGLRVYVWQTGGCGPVFQECAPSPQPGRACLRSAPPDSPPGTTGRAPPASALGWGVPPLPPSFPGEEQRIAQASGSGGGGGRKGERRKRDLNERR